MNRTETLVLTPVDKAGHRGPAVEVPFTWTDPAGPAALRIGASKGSVGISTVDAMLRRKAEPVRVFEQGIPQTWAQTDDVPADGRQVLVSCTGDVNAFARGDYDNQVRGWLGGSPLTTMAAALHEGDAKVRKGTYTRPQWVAAQEAFLPVVAAAGRIPAAIITYQSITDGSAPQYISSAMRAVPGLVLVVDSYQPGVPSATPAKMLKGIDVVAAQLGLPWGIGEFGIGLNNGTDEERATQLRANLQYAADHGASFLDYWPNAGEKADYTPGPASWAALGADYSIGA